MPSWSMTDEEISSLIHPKKKNTTGLREKDVLMLLLFHKHFGVSDLQMCKYLTLYTVLSVYGLLDSCSDRIKSERLLEYNT